MPLIEYIGTLVAVSAQINQFYIEIGFISQDDVKKKENRTKLQRKKFLHFIRCCSR